MSTFKNLEWNERSKIAEKTLWVNLMYSILLKLDLLFADTMFARFELTGVKSMRKGLV